MKAVRVHKFGGPEVLQLDSGIQIPKPGSKDVLVQVRAVGVNPVETYIRAGAYARTPELPFTPGHDCAGIIYEVGAEVKGLNKGDRVFTSRTITGAYAEFTLAPSSSVYPLPEPLSFVQGAGLSTPYLTAYRALIQRGLAKAGETVLVHGASGGVGIAAVQIARAYGMKVMGTAGTQDGMKLVEKAGSHFVFNHRNTGYLDDVKRAAGEHGIDVIVENASHMNLGTDLPLLAFGGRVAIVGSRGPVQINPRDTMSRESTIVGVMLGHASEKDLAEAHAAIQAGANTGWLRPIVGKEFPLEKASEAHRDIVSGSGALGKMVLSVL